MIDESDFKRYFTNRLEIFDKVPFERDKFLLEKYKHILEYGPNIAKREVFIEDIPFIIKEIFNENFDPNDIELIQWPRNDGYSDYFNVIVNSKEIKSRDNYLLEGISRDFMLIVNILKVLKEDDKNDR